MSENARPLAVLLHGFPDVAGNWATISALLEDAGIATLALTLPGYPCSCEPIEAQACTPVFAVDWLLERLADYRGPVHLVGHDWGAVVTYLAAAAHPDRFASVTALAIPPLQRLPMVMLRHPRQWWRSRYMLFFQLPWLPERRLARGNGEVLARLWRRWSPGWDGSGHLESVRAQLSEPVVLHRVLEWYRCLARPWRKDLRRGWAWRARPVAVPCLVMMGRRDGCMGIELLAECIRDNDFPAGIEVAVLEDAGHFLHLERPLKVAAHVVRHILDARAAGS